MYNYHVFLLKIISFFQCDMKLLHRKVDISLTIFFTSLFNPFHQSSGANNGVGHLHTVYTAKEEIYLYCI